MLISKQSALSKKWHTLEIPVTEAQLVAWKNGALIQDACPNLTPGQRQFIISGVTEAEWDQAFGDEDNINPDDLMAVAMHHGKTVIVVKP